MSALGKLNFTETSKQFWVGNTLAVVELANTGLDKVHGGGQEQFVGFDESAKGVGCDLIAAQKSFFNATSVDLCEVEM